MPIKTEQITRVTLTDDLTGKTSELSDKSQATEIKLTVNGKSVTLATTAEIAAALAAFVADPSDANLRAVGDLGVFPKSPVSKSGASNGNAKLKMRDGREVSRSEFEAWAREHGHPVNTGRGAQKSEVLDAWISDHPAEPASEGAPAA